MNEKAISDCEGNVHFYLNISLVTYLFTMNNLPKLTAHRKSLVLPTALSCEKWESAAARVKLQSLV